MWYWRSWYRRDKRRRFGESEAPFPYMGLCGAPDGTCNQWREIPPMELSIALVADERMNSR